MDIVTKIDLGEDCLAYHVGSGVQTCADPRPCPISGPVESESGIVSRHSGSESNRRDVEFRHCRSVT